MLTILSFITGFIGCLIALITLLFFSILIEERNLDREDAELDAEPKQLTVQFTLKIGYTPESQTYSAIVEGDNHEFESANELFYFVHSYLNPNDRSYPPLGLQQPAKPAEPYNPIKAVLPDAYTNSY